MTARLASGAILGKEVESRLQVEGHLVFPDRTLDDTADTGVHIHGNLYRR